MSSPTPRAVLVAAVLAAVAGCAGGGAGHQVAGAPQPSGSPQSESYTADQLAQALLTGMPGYTPSGPPQRGPYGSLPAVQSTAQMQQSATLDKPQCANASRSVAVAGGGVQAAPAALAAFDNGGDQTATEALMAVGPDAAAQVVGLRVPAACRTFRVRVGGRWAADTVVEARGVRIGEGSRSVGVATTAGTATVRTWSVVLRSRGYLAAVTLFGPGATRADAESLARRAYQQAERILP